MDFIVFNDLILILNWYSAANKFAVQLGNDGGNVLLLAPDELELVEKAKGRGDTGPGFYPPESIMR
jgi:hypothetical protein